MQESDDGIDEFEEDFECENWDDEDLLDIPTTSADQKIIEDPSNKFNSGKDPLKKLDKKEKVTTSKRGILIFLSFFLLIIIGTGTYGYLASSNRKQETPVIKLGATTTPENSQQIEPQDNSIGIAPQEHFIQQGGASKTPPRNAHSHEENPAPITSSNRLPGLTPLPSDFDNKVELAPLPALTQPKTGQAEKLQQEKNIDQPTENQELSLLENKLLSKTEEMPEQSIDVYDNAFEEIPTEPVLGELDIKDEPSSPSDLNPFTDEINLDNALEEPEVFSEKPNPIENASLIAETLIEERLPLKEKAKAEEIKPTPAPTAKAEIVPVEINAKDTKKQAQQTSPNAARVMTKKPKEPVIAVEIPKWEIRGIQPNSAIIHDRKTGETRTVEPGNNIKGIGQVKAIKKLDGVWTVIGTKANIN